MKRLFLFLPLILAACASISPEARLRTGLIDAGLGQRQSACMAGRMTDKLSLLQLRRLASLKNFDREPVRGMSTERFLHNVRALEDSEILRVTTRAALGCAISG